MVHPSHRYLLRLPSVPWRTAPRTRTSGAPNLPRVESAQALFCCARQNRLPRSPALPVAYAILDPRGPPRVRPSCLQTEGGCECRFRSRTERLRICKVSWHKALFFNAFVLDESMCLLQPAAALGRNVGFCQESPETHTQCAGRNSLTESACRFSSEPQRACLSGADLLDRVEAPPLGKPAEYPAQRSSGTDVPVRLGRRPRCGPAGLFRIRGAPYPHRSRESRSTRSWVQIPPATAHLMSGVPQNC
jgi:hypothetical protein